MNTNRDFFMMKKIAILFLWLHGTVTQIHGQDSIQFVEDRGFPHAHFYFKGEAHEFQANNANALLALLRFLHANHQVRYLLMEFGPDQAYLANYYLRYGGDSVPSIAKLYMPESFWRELRSFNEQLSSDERIAIAGFDFNRFFHNSRALRLMFLHKDVENTELKENLERLFSWDTIAWNFDFQDKFEKELADLRESRKAAAAELEFTLGDDYAVYLSIIENSTPSMPSVKRQR